MDSASAWERIERQKLRGRERRTRHNRPGDRPDPSRPVGTDMLPQIKHIVVLMMENHSFDNYLGTLGRGEGFPLGDDGTPDAENPDSAGTMIRAHHAKSTVQQEGVPCQSWSATHAQWADGKLNGFVTSAEQAAPEGDKTAAMSYWTGEDLPFYHGLAQDLSAGRPVVQLVPRADVPEPPVPAGRDGQRPDGRPASEPAGPAEGRHDHGHAGPAQDLLGQLPAGQRPVRVPPLRGIPASPDPAPSDLPRPLAAQPRLRVPARPPVHGGPLPARDDRLHGPRAQHRAVLRGCRLRQSPLVLHRRPGLPQLL